MKIRVKKARENRILRLEGGGEVKEILINEDFLHPDKEGISLCFRGSNSSGIIEISLKELDMVHSALKAKKHIIKGVKILKFDKD